MKYCDKNLRYFYIIAFCRVNVNNIKQLRVGVYLVYFQVKIRKGILEYFKEIFKEDIKERFFFRGFDYLSVNEDKVFNRIY